MQVDHSHSAEKHLFGTSSYNNCFFFLPVPLSYLYTLLHFLLKNELVSFGWSFEHGAATCVYMKNTMFPKKQNDIHTVANSLVFMLQVKSVLYAFT